MSAPLPVPDPSGSPRFTLLDLLGQGGQSVVHVAHDAARSGRVALKTLAPGVDQELGRTLLRREFYAMASLSHPGIVAVHDLGELPDGRPFFTMDLISGRPFTDALRGASEPRVFAAIAAVLRALDAVHRRGLVHGDVKPGNILVRDEGGADAVTLLDFGLAAGAEDHVLGLLRGTVAYLAPEVIRGATVDGRADLYSLGATVYELLTGAPPFTDADPEAVLRMHLDAEPMPVTGVSQGMARLVERLLAKDPRRRFASAADALLALRAHLGVQERGEADESRPAVALAPSFVGRDAELDLLAASVGEARHGRGCVLRIVGPEGSGRSRLLAEHRVRAGLAGAHPVAVRPGGRPLQPWRGVADALAARSGTRSAADELRAVLDGGPGKEGGAGRSGGDDLEADARRIRVLDAASRALARAARASPDEPLLLHLDDAGTLDAASLELARYLARQAGSLPLCIVATGGEGEGVLDEERRLELAPLSVAQVGALAASALGVASVAHADAEQLLEESGGWPADVEELVRALVAAGHLRREADGSVTLAREALSHQPASERTAAWITAARAALSAPAARLAPLASLLPQPFDAALLAAVAGTSEADTARQLGELEAGGLVRCIRASYAVPARILRHLADGLPPAERRELLHRIATTLEELGPRLRATVVTDALLADLREQGPEPMTAVPHLLKAAAEASAALALPDAIRDLERALALMPEEDPRSVQAWEDLGDVLADVGDLPRAAAAYERLLPAASGEGTPPARARIRLKLAKVAQRRGSYELAHELLRHVLADLDRGRDAGLISDVLARISAIYRARGILPDALAHAERALKVGLESAEASKVANAYNHLGLIHSGRGDMAQAQMYYERALLALAGMEHAGARMPSSAAISEEVVARAAADPLRARVAVNNLGSVHWKTGDWGAAARAYETALELAERVGDLSGIASASNNLALIRFCRGDWVSSLVGFRRSLEVKSRLGDPVGRATALVNIAEVEERTGQWHDSRDHYEQGIEIYARLKAPKDEGLCLLSLGNLLRKMGDEEAAVRSLDAGRTLVERTGDADALAHALWCRAMLDRDRGDMVTALRLLTEAMAILERSGQRLHIGKVLTSVADLAMRLADIDRAAELAERSLTLAREMGDRFEEGKALSVVGRVHYARRNRASARAAFEEGIAILEELGARFELARSLHEHGLRIEDAARAERQVEKAIGIFRALPARPDLERATGTLDRIRENLAGFDAPEPRTFAKVVGLYEIGRLVNSLIDEDEMLERVMEVVVERTRADRALILLLEPDGRLRVRASRNVARETLKQTSEISESVIREVLKSQGPVLTGSTREDPRFAAQRSIIRHGIVSIAAVPLRIRGRIAGAIYLDHLKEPDYFTQKDLEFLQAFADQAAVAMENARLYRELREASDRLVAENKALRAETRKGPSEIVGKSKALQGVLALARKAAATGETTLVTGESGTGKSFVARAIHAMSPRREGPFVKFNCAALPETLMESELFGHEKGAFTGADKRKLGRFEVAHHGVIFLDEIGNVSLAVQSKLLRILEDKEFERVGGTQTIRSDVQIIAATNRDLEKAIRDGSFREDLFYRLDVFPIRMPPLRERKEDIPMLAEQFLQTLRGELDLDLRGITDDARELLTSYDWPGNVRELQSSIRRAAVLADGPLIGAPDLRWLSPQPGSRSERAAPTPARREELLEEVVGAFVDAPRRGEKIFQTVTENLERVLIRRILAESAGQIRVASRKLGVARNTLRAKMKRYGLAGRDEGADARVDEGADARHDEGADARHDEGAEDEG